MKHPHTNVHVFAVWEPMLPTDWRSPGTIVLRRIGDRRVSQYWDADHVLAHRMAEDARPPQPAESCCVRSDTLWDLAAVYPKDARWTDRLPPATVFDGPVVNVIGGVERAIVSVDR